MCDAHHSLWVFSLSILSEHCPYPVLILDCIFSVWSTLVSLPYFYHVPGLASMQFQRSYNHFTNLYFSFSRNLFWPEDVLQRIHKFVSRDDSSSDSLHVVVVCYHHSKIFQASGSFTVKVLYWHISPYSVHSIWVVRWHTCTLFCSGLLIPILLIFCSNSTNCSSTAIVNLASILVSSAKAMSIPGPSTKNIGCELVCVVLIFRSLRSIVWRGWCYYTLA